MLYCEHVLLKNGQDCLLRNGEEADAQAVCRLFMQTHAETDYLLSYPEEANFGEDAERVFLTEKKQSENEIELCAFIRGEIVGSAGVEAVGRKEKVRHRAELGISVKKAFWGMGIGRALMIASLKCAKEAGYRQLELQVVKENERAVALYESLGFTVYGCNPRGFLSRESGWQEVLLMRLPLNDTGDEQAAEGV